MMTNTRYMTYDDWQNIRDENTGIVENSFLLTEIKDSIISGNTNIFVTIDGTPNFILSYDIEKDQFIEIPVS